MDARPLRLLSLDGGGVKGLTSLLLLKEIFRALENQGYSVQPHEYFDLIGGTSTGGLIAIMLGCLRMTVDEALEAYKTLSPEIFKKKWWTQSQAGKYTGAELRRYWFEGKNLENAVQKLLRDRRLDPDLKLLELEASDCRVFVCAVNAVSLHTELLRSYKTRRIGHQDYDCSVWEAVRATSAAPLFFEPITLQASQHTFVDGALRANNPVDQVISEARFLWPGRGIGCLISLGTGVKLLQRHSTQKSRLHEVLHSLADIATDANNKAREFRDTLEGRELIRSKRYFRYSVPYGVGEVDLADFEEVPYMESMTLPYMVDIDDSIEDCARSLANPSISQNFYITFSLAAAPEIDYFVGRAGNLLSIESVLLPFIVAERKVVVLHGLGGIGKSQLAIEYAKKHRHDYSAVLWLNAKTEDTLMQSFAANARRLPEHYFNQEALYGPQNKDALNTIIRDMKKWLNSPGNDQWLLIYDNVDNPKIPDNKSENAYNIRAYFPEAHQGSIIVTTRWQTLRIGCLQQVAKLSSSHESISLLERTSNRVNIADEPGIESLLKKLDGLPLALATAGAYLGLTSMPVLEYLGYHETSWLELHQQSPKLLSYEDQTLYSTWNLSYMHIRKEDIAAARILELWVYFDHQDLWFELLEAGRTDEAPAWFLAITQTELTFKGVMVKLQKHALIESLTGSNGYSMHYCVHSWAKAVLCISIERRVLQLVFNCIDKTIPVFPVPDDWKVRQRLLPHAARGSQLLHLWRGDEKGLIDLEVVIVRFLGNLGFLYWTQGKLQEAESMYQRALASYEQALGRDHILILETVNNLGIIYRHQGKLREAESMYRRALAGLKQTLGQDHPSTLEIVSNLGILYYNQGKLREAESMYRRALAGLKQTLGQDHPSTLEVVNNLGILYYNQGKLREAESMYQRALASYEQTLGQDHPLTLEIANNLGVLYYNQGKLREAESMYQRALAGYSKNPKWYPRRKAKTFFNTGLLFRTLQNLEEALECFKQAHKIYLELFGPQNAKTMKALNQVKETIESQKAAASSGQIN